MELLRDEKRLHHVVYNVVWTTRRRSKVLVEKIADRCREIIQEICAEKGWEIKSLIIEPDNISIVIRVWPSNSPEDVIKEFKAKTAHYLRKEFSTLQKLPSMWTRNYFAITLGKQVKENIRTFIDSQKGI